MFRSICFAVLIFCCTLQPCASAAQEIHAEDLNLQLEDEHFLQHEHASDNDTVARSSALSLPDVLEAAHSAHPDSLLHAGRDLADAELTRGANRLLSGPAMLSLRYEDDTIGSNVGLQEWGSTIDFSLFMPSERQARQLTAEQQHVLSEAIAKASRLQIAGQLRRTLWDIKAAEVSLDLAQLAVQSAKRMQQTVQKRVAAGASAAAELPLLAAMTQQRQAEALDARVELSHSHRRYSVLTGLETLPMDIAENPVKLNDEQAIIHNHPLLQLARQQREFAAANLNLAERTWQRKPTLGVGMRGERGRADQQYVEVAGLFVTIPLDFGGYNSTQKSQSRIRLAEAERDHQSMLRQLRLDLHDAELNHLSAERASKLARQRAELSQQAHELAMRAYELGEIELTALLRAADEQRQAALELGLREVKLQQTTAMLNQAAGQLPE